jgi:hypothetical protein
MKLFLPALVILVSLLAAPATAQERTVIVNQTIFEPDRKAGLALDYLEGRGGRQDDTQALKWWIVARAIERPIERITPETPFRCGYEMAAAAVQLNVLEDRMTPDQIVKAQNMAREWLGAHPR